MVNSNSVLNVCIAAAGIIAAAVPKSIGGIIAAYSGNGAMYTNPAGTQGKVNFTLACGGQQVAGVNITPRGSGAYYQVTSTAGKGRYLPAALKAAGLACKPYASGKYVGAAWVGPVGPTQAASVAAALAAWAGTQHKAWAAKPTAPTS